MHAAFSFFRSVVESTGAAGGVHLGGKGGPPKTATEGTFPLQVWAPVEAFPGCSGPRAYSRGAGRVRSSCLGSPSTEIPPRRPPNLGKGDPDRRPPRARGASPRRPPEGAAADRECWLGECRLLPPGEEMWGPRVGDRLAWVVLAGPPIPSRPHPFVRALHRIALFRAPPRGQLRRGTTARTGCGNPELGGVSEGFPGQGSRAGDPNPDAWSGSGPNL